MGRDHPVTDTILIIRREASWGVIHGVSAGITWGACTAVRINPAGTVSIDRVFCLDVTVDIIVALMTVRTAQLKVIRVEIYIPTGPDTARISEKICPRTVSNIHPGFKDVKGPPVMTLKAEEKVFIKGS